MTVYLVNIALTAALALAGGTRAAGGRESRERASLLSALLILAVWTAVYALRGTSVGADTFGYYFFYKLAAVARQTLPQYLAEGGDLLFEILRYCCAKASGGNWVLFMVVTGVLTYLPVLLAIRRDNSELFVMSVLIYIFSYQYYFGMNGTRQAIAISITFFAYVYFFKERRYVWYAILILVATGFHSTAPVVVIFHLLSRLRVESATVWFVAAILAVSAFSASSLWSAIISVFDLLGNSHMVSHYSDFDAAGGSGFIRVLVSATPLALALWQRKNISINSDKNIGPYLIMSLFATILMLLSMQNWLFSRISGYLSIYLVLYVPSLRYSFGERTQGHVSLIIYTLYFLYMLVLLLYGDGGYYPYSFIGL